MSFANMGYSDFCHSKFHIRFRQLSSWFLKGISFLPLSSETYLPSAAKLRQGNVFRSVCQEFCPHWGEGGCLPQCMLGYTHPPLQTATAADGTHPTGMHSCFWLFSGSFSGNGQSVISSYAKNQ